MEGHMADIIGSSGPSRSQLAFLLDFALVTDERTDPNPCVTDAPVNSVTVLRVKGTSSVKVLALVP